MSIIYPKTNDPVVGHSDPLYPNTWDSASMQLQETFLVEHSVNGVHAMTEGGHCLMEVGSYIGNGQASRTISINAATLAIKYICVFKASAFAFQWIATPVMPANKSKLCYDTGFATDGILSMGTGQFSVGASANSNTVEFHYQVFGVLQMQAGTPSYMPAWIQHGESIVLDANSDGPPTRVAKDIVSRFLVEHAADGSHSTSAKIAVGTYPGSGTTQNITLPINMTVKHLHIWRDGSYYPIIKTDQMTTTLGKKMDNTAYASNMVQILTANGFQVLSSTAEVNAAGVTYYYAAWGE